jgi:preprotein translocase SecE subunit
MRHVSVGAGETNGQEPEQDDDSTRTVDDDTVSTAIDASSTNTASEEKEEEEEEEEAVLSTEEIQRQMGALRAAAAAASQDEASKDASLMDGVLEEVRLIEWPSFTSALLNTVLVIALVLGTSVVLFGVNTSLSEISRQIYSSSGGASSG